MMQKSYATQETRCTIRKRRDGQRYTLDFTLNWLIHKPIRSAWIIETDTDIPKLTEKGKMKNKSSDNTLSRDGLPEHNQEPTKKGKIKLLDVVALTQDVPEHNLKRGEVGTIVEILSNGEAFEVEFSDDNGQMYKCLSFLVSQLTVLHHEPISESKQKQEPTTRKNPAAQHLIKAMEKPPHLTDEDIDALNQSIKEGKIPIKFNSPLEPDEREKE